MWHADAMDKWSEIKTEFITGDMTLQALEKQPGVSERQIYAHSKEGNWREKRRKHREKVTDNACARAGARQSRKLARIITTVDRLAEQIEEELRDPRAIHRHVGMETSEEGSVGLAEYDFAAINAGTVRDMTRSLRDLTIVIRDLYGIDTRREQVADRREDAKLALEERKTALAERAAELQARESGADGGLTVRIEGVPEEYTP